jgi:dihydroorotase-like cyclic amidohydrolase
MALMDAVRKMSYLPALRLERSTPEARKKGRLQIGADADIVILDPTRSAISQRSKNLLYPARACDSSL